MKKLLKFSRWIVASSAVLPSVVSAQPISNNIGDVNNVNVPTNLNVIDVIAKAANWIFALGFALAVLFLIVGGVRYVISSGNEDQVEKARHTIFNAVIGIIVILLALVILNTVKTFF